MKKIFSLIIALPIFASSLLELDLINHWQKEDGNLKIIKLNISPKPSLDCRILNYPKLSKKGFFKANCNEQNIQFRFSLEATSKVFVLKKDVLKDEVIGFFDLKSEQIDFSKVPYNALKNINQELRFKNKVKAGNILRDSMIMPSFLINKGDSVVGIIDDGDLSVFVDLIALQSGVKGQKIRLKNMQGKFLTGEIVNDKQVLIK